MIIRYPFPGLASRIQNKKSLILILLLILSLLWGTSFKLVKEGLIAFGPSELAALRISLAFIFSLPFSVVRIREVKRDQLWKFLLVGSAGFFFPSFLYALAQTKVNSSLAGMLNSFGPICTLFVSALFFKQRFPKMAIIAAAISLAGCVILALARDNGVVVGINYFSLFVVLACCCLAFHVNFVKFHLPDVNSVTLTSVSLLLLGPVAITYLFSSTGFVSIMQTHPRAWWSFSMAGILGLFNTVIAHFLFYRMLRISSPLLASSANYIMPLVAIGWGMRDDELLTTGHLMGMVFILIGVYLTTRQK